MDKAFIELEINETIMRSEVEELKRICEMHIKSLYNVNLAKAEERINKAIEYIENNSLYEPEYDYDYEENSYLSGIDDEIAKKDLLNILKGEGWKE